MDVNVGLLTDMAGKYADLGNDNVYTGAEETTATYHSIMYNMDSDRTIIAFFKRANHRDGTMSMTRSL